MYSDKTAQLIICDNSSAKVKRAQMGEIYCKARFPACLMDIQNKI